MVILPAFKMVIRLPETEATAGSDELKLIGKLELVVAEMEKATSPKVLEPVELNEMV